VTPLEYFWLSYGLAFLANLAIERLVVTTETQPPAGDIRRK
jgi:hypothetical protein